MSAIIFFIAASVSARNAACSGAAAVDVATATSSAPIR
jgi:hypothetical protein